MMIVIWCRDWEDASKFHYLMQILQPNCEDYIPKWQIFVEQEETVQKHLVHWQSPTTIWEGRPVLGFMAETHLSDLMTVGFKHFNSMWSFPSTSVYQNWDPITFGMPAWHLTDDTSHDKDALVCGSRYDLLHPIMDDFLEDTWCEDYAYRQGHSLAQSCRNSSQTLQE